MPRRVGSPKASVMADTVAVNAPGVHRRASERSCGVATPVFYLSRVVVIRRTSQRRPPAHRVPACRHRQTRSSTRCARSRIPSCTARSSTSAWCATSIDRPTATCGVLIALTVAGCPLRNEITDRVTGAVDAARRRHATSPLDFTVMTDQEREALRIKLHGDPAATAGHGQAHGHAEGRADPVRRARLEDPAAADLVGQGRRRQVAASPPTSPSRSPSRATRSASSTPTSTASRSRACSAPTAIRS